MYGCCLLITSPDNKVSKSLKTNLLPTNVENTKNGKFKINADMMNLVGCSKENFYKLMNLMNYKKENNNSEIFCYRGEKKNKNKIKFTNNKGNPFKKLMALNLK